MEINAYLNRIYVDQVKNTSLEDLEKLQYQHMLHVPFENLDVMRNVPIVLDVDAFYEKVVTRHRGGFCYELNGLFFALLKRLGFACQFVSATVGRPDGTWAKAGSHACTIVTIDDKLYVTDVGFGDSARKPLPLTGEKREDVSGAYHLEKVTTNLYDVKRKRDGDAKPSTVLRIDTHPKKLQDFTDVSIFNQTSPESHFTQKEIVTLATPDGRITLSGNTLTTTHNGKKKRETISDGDKPTILETYFQIVMG